MMSISLPRAHLRPPSRTRVLDRFLTWAGEQPNVWWARRDQIADWAVQTPEITPSIERAPAEESGLPTESRTPLTPAQPP